jgi:transcriptional regulator with XRE-family HTH domain
MMSKRAAPNVRYFLGQRLRALRAERGMTQLGLARDSGLTATFIGQVERGQKSISVDSLYHIASALKIPLRWLTDVPRGRHPSPEAERLFALVACANRRGDLTRVYRKLTRLLGNGRSNGRN